MILFFTSSSKLTDFLFDYSSVLLESKAFYPSLHYRSISSSMLDSMSSQEDPILFCYSYCSERHSKAKMGSGSSALFLLFLLISLILLG